MKRFTLAAIFGFAATYWFFRLPYSHGKRHKGFIFAISPKENGDVAIKMNKDKDEYLISRGSNLGIDIKKLKTKLIGKRAYVWVTHPKWPIDNTPFITRMICDNEVIYSKW